MTKKDYVKIANAIRERFGVQPTKCDDLDGFGGYLLGIHLVTSDLAHLLAADNPRFDRARFLKACGLPDPNPER